MAKSVKKPAKAKKSVAAPKLTPKDVRMIRAKYKRADKKWGQAALAARFGVSTSTVYNALHGRNWKSL